MSSENGDAIMRQNVAESNAWGADVHYVSHTNAVSNGAAQTKVSGCNPMYYTYSKNGKKLGEIMVKYRRQVYPSKVTLVARSGLYELRVPNAVSFYEEHAFHDNPNDIGWWHEHMTEVAESAAKGLCEWFGIPYVDEPKTEPEKNILYRVQVGAFRVKANAEAQLEKLKAAGFDGFIVEVEK